MNLHVVEQDRTVAEFVHQGEHLYEKQRAVVRDLVTRHNLERAKMVDDYRRRLDDLIFEESEVLRRLDNRNAKELAEAQSLLDALERLRGE